MRVAGLGPARPIFVDETGTNVSLTRRSGRAPRGHRVVGQVPRNHGPNMTLIAALDGSAFDAYVTRILGLQLWPGESVTCVNLSAHKHKHAWIWIESIGVQGLNLPAYSPDFDPAFSKLKTSLRGAGAQTRTELDQAITAALGTITNQDAAAWFAHCGDTMPAQLL